MPDVRLDYIPQEKQLILHRSGERQIFYGGSAGGGKSHGLRWDGINLSLLSPNLQTYLFRRTLPELEDNHIIYLRRLPDTLGSFHETRKEFNFINGSTIHCGYAERESDIWRYRGAEMHVLLVDEASLMTPLQLGALRAWNRLGGYIPDPRVAGALPRCVFASNPGNVGHSFLKRIFIDPAPAGTVFFDRSMRDPADPDDPGWSTIYIRAMMSDNKYLDRNYGGSFGGLPPEMAQAYREGDWDVVVGAALHNLSKQRHQLRPHLPPRHWTHFMSIDWGTARPFSVGWYYVSETDLILEARDGWDAVDIPAGAVVRFMEWYGWNGNENEGCRWDSTRVAHGIRDMERERKLPSMDQRIGDSEMWAQRDGPGPAERMGAEGVSLIRSIKDRRRNYAEIIARLAGRPRPDDTKDGASDVPPMFFVTADCKHFWRTMPPLTSDKIEPDKGPDTKLEDHVYDEVAYALRSRPFITTERDRWEQQLRAEGFMTDVADPYCTDSV